MLTLLLVLLLFFAPAFIGLYCYGRRGEIIHHRVREAFRDFGITTTYFYVEEERRGWFGGWEEVTGTRCDTPEQSLANYAKLRRPLMIGPILLDASTTSPMEWTSDAVRKLSNQELAARLAEELELAYNSARISLLKAESRRRHREG